jgi:hypothetical protein
LALVDLRLFSHFVVKERLRDARSTLEECLGTSDRILQLHPQDWTAQYCRFSAYNALGSVADSEGSRDESIRHFERAVGHGQECLRLRADPELIAGLAKCRWALAQFLRQKGENDAALALILANFRMLADLPAANDSAMIAAWRTLVCLDVHEFDAYPGPVLVPSSPQGNSDELDPLSRLVGSDLGGLAEQSWAELVALSLSSSRAPVDLPYDVVRTFITCLADRIAWQRRSSRPDEARRSAGRMHAFARLLVERNPTRPVAHMALCASFTQMAKNSWKLNDRRAIRRNWTLALDEARTALMLDPQDAWAGAQVSDLRKRLDQFLAGTARPGGSDAISHVPRGARSGRSKD